LDRLTARIATITVSAIPLTKQFNTVQIGNHLLAELPDTVLHCLKANLQPVPLRSGQWLFRAHDPLTDVYFPESGVVSMVVHLRRGEALDVGIVGNDGVVGIPTGSRTDAMACDGVVQIDGVAQRIDADLVRRQMALHEPLDALLSSFAHLMLSRSMQSAACIAFHSAKERCARWLLMTQDLVGSDELPLTHDRLARMLGVRRVSVTLVLGTLVAAGLVGRSRGRLVIRNRSGLERASCECYQATRDERLRLLGF